MTSDLRVALFNRMGAHVSLQDIDIAHRVQSHKQNGGPKPIICKFVRCLAKYEAKARRQDVCKVDPVRVGFSESVQIFDHLTPNQQQIFYEAKKFKDRHKLQYCWVKTPTSTLARRVNLGQSRSRKSEIYSGWRRISHLPCNLPAE